MFSQIVNPKTNKKVNINSKEGKDILNNYINIQSGGRVEWNHESQRFITRSVPGTRTEQRSLAEIRLLHLLNVEYNGQTGDIQHYANFWSNPSPNPQQLRESLFGYWGYDRFISAGLSYFLHRSSYQDSQRIIDLLYEIIRLRFLDSRMHAHREDDNLHRHHRIIRGTVEAFWRYTERFHIEDRIRLRQRLNNIHPDFEQTVGHDGQPEFNEFINARLAELNWHEALTGLNSSLLNFQLSDESDGRGGRYRRGGRDRRGGSGGRRNRGRR